MDREAKRKIVAETSGELDKFYDRAWHNGRHEYRNKLVKSKFLIINPNKVEELELIALNDPCSQDCPYWDSDSRTGCTKRFWCDNKQKQIDALDILEHFK